MGNKDSRTFEINPKIEMKKVRFPALIVPGADHVDLYDNMKKIPFDKLEQFFNENLR